MSVDIDVTADLLLLLQQNLCTVQYTDKVVFPITLCCRRKTLFNIVQSEGNLTQIVVLVVT